MEKKVELPRSLALRILMFVAIVVVIFNVLNVMSTVLGVSIVGSIGGSSATFTESTPGSLLPYGVTFDNAGYEKLLGYYNTITLNSLTAEQKQRFIRIGTRDRTGCGPCCGIGNGPGIDTNGNTRCGCGHNLALIGLMKHFVKNYGDAYTDDQIFGEIVKWKKLFFPGQVADDGIVIK
jgi:hypothetical protein